MNKIFKSLLVGLGLLVGGILIAQASTVLSIPQGGTSSSTATGAFNALAPSQTGQGGNFLQTNGATTTWTSAVTGTPWTAYGYVTGTPWTTAGYLTAVSVVSSNGFGGSSSGGTTPSLTLSTSCNGMCKANGTAISTASNGTDYTLVSANTCSAGQHISALTASGGSTCSADTGTGGITSLNGLTTSTQTFATGTDGTDFGIVSSGSTHTFNIPTASASNRGLLSSSDWTTFNGKGSGTVTGTCSGMCKASGSVISTASSGIDYTLITAQHCPAGQHILNLYANGTSDCSTDASASGMANPFSAPGDMVYAVGTSTPTALHIGTSGQVMTVSTGGIPTWGNSTYVKWSSLAIGTDVSSTAPTIGQLTMMTNQTANIALGDALQITAGGVTYYEKVNTLSPSLMSFYGPGISTSTNAITAVSYSTYPEMVEVMSWMINGNFDSATTTTMFQDDLNYFFRWDKPKAHCIYFSLKEKTANSGATQPAVNFWLATSTNVIYNGNSGLGLRASTAWVNTDNALTNASTTVNLGDTIEMSVSPGTNGDAKDLSAQLSCVYE